MRNVIMMHSVGSNHTGWKENWLSIDKQQFEMFCCYLAKHGYKTHFLDYWYEQQNQSIKDKKDLYITFDDGYLDNLLVAYPIMKKYGIKGTIFVNPEFVDPSSGIRSLETTRGDTLGFLNWDEIRFLDQSGVIDIQSHSMSHNYYFKSSRMIDVHGPDNTYHWLAWIMKPEMKYAWQSENQSSFTAYGYPIFEYYRALGLRRYFPDEEIVRKSIEMYEVGRDKNDIIIECTKMLERYPGRFETDDEMLARYNYELAESKRILEEQLGKRVDFLCWPGGGYNEDSLRLSQEAGYKASTVGSRESHLKFNNEGKTHKRILRYGMDSLLSKGGYFRPHRMVPSNYKPHLILKLKNEEKRLLAYIFCRINGIILRFF